jgi:hypothetical protein
MHEQQVYLTHWSELAIMAARPQLANHLSCILVQILDARQPSRATPASRFWTPLDRPEQNLFNYTVCYTSIKIGYKTQYI